MKNNIIEIVDSSFEKAVQEIGWCIDYCKKERAKGISEDVILRGLIRGACTGLRDLIKHKLEENQKYGRFNDMDDLFIRKDELEEYQERMFGKYAGKEKGTINFTTIMRDKILKNTFGIKSRLAKEMSYSAIVSRAIHFGKMHGYSDEAMFVCIIRGLMRENEALLKALNEEKHHFPKEKL